ncbi:hypothetical protein K469DRAFT_753670 [Zopfia rhizophila CBS 207.26]|uniref:Uncharacterized protein n=1 Tax=Zopfia rhizophila CBS 207.26 TaxID=1314779 RepID=A0A6A6DJU5_9PEZI|nr:hypothetical protein K469DRAFT_753670 [Zopfia rhizophila CBS 207.26]
MFTDIPDPSCSSYIFMFIIFVGLGFFLWEQFGTGRLRTEIQTLRTEVDHQCKDIRHISTLFQLARNQKPPSSSSYVIFNGMEKDGSPNHHSTPPPYQPGSAHSVREMPAGTGTDAPENSNGRGIRAHDQDLGEYVEVYAYRTLGQDLSNGYAEPSPTPDDEEDSPLCWFSEEQLVEHFRELQLSEDEDGQLLGDMPIRVHEDADELLEGYVETIPEEGENKVVRRAEPPVDRPAKAAKGKEPVCTRVHKHVLAQPSVDDRPWTHVDRLFGFDPASARSVNLPNSMGPRRVQDPPRTQAPQQCMISGVLATPTEAGSSINPRGGDRQVGVQAPQRSAEAGSSSQTLEPAPPPTPAPYFYNPGGRITYRYVPVPGAAGRSLPVYGGPNWMTRVGRVLPPSTQIPPAQPPVQLQAHLPQARPLHPQQIYLGPQQPVFQSPQGQHSGDQPSRNQVFWHPRQS